MRELILKMSISIDGFVASPDGGVKWIFDTHDDKAAEWTVKTVWDASLHIMGSRTFHDMAAYWRMLKLLSSTTFPRGTVAQIYRHA